MPIATWRSVRSGERQSMISQLNSIAQQEIRKAMNEEVKPVLIKSHEKIVEDWEHEVGFKARTYIRHDSISVYVFADGENKKIWIFVNEGTKPHVIRPKGPWPLRFKTGYTPKTLARPARTVLGGGRATGPEVRAMVVHHPGSEGRHFTRQIAIDVQPGFRRLIENAFRRVARRVST